MNNKGLALLIGLLVILVVGGGILAVTAFSKTISLFNFYKKIKTKSGAMKGRVALARKLLTIMWYMIHKQQDYVAY